MVPWISRSLLAVLAVSAAVTGIRGSAASPEIAGAAAPAVAGPIAGALHPSTHSILIPVAGVERSELRDTWGEARSGGRRHAAIDIMAPRGTPALAAIDGTVLKLFRSDAGGITLYLADSRNEIVCYYAHLDDYAPGIREGMEVKRGDVIGYVGTTGNAPKSAPHLHFAWERLPATGEWWKGVPENPYPILMERGETVGGR